MLSGPLRILVYLKLAEFPVRICKRLGIIRYKVRTVVLSPTTDALMRANAGGRTCNCIAQVSFFLASSPCATSSRSIKAKNKGFLSQGKAITHSLTRPTLSQA